MSDNSPTIFTRIYPYGPAEAEELLTLASTTRVALRGYTLNKEENYIEDDSATAYIGFVVARHLHFTEIDQDADALFDAAFEHLTSTLATISDIIHPRKDTQL